MIGSLLFLALQAATPQDAPMAAEAAAPAPPQSAEAEVVTAAATTPAEPERKRVCRTVVDTRTGIVGKRSKVCRFVDETEGKSR